MDNSTQHRSWIVELRRVACAALALAIVFLPEVVASRSAQAQDFTTFNAPGAGTSSGQGTLPENINTAGDIAGILH